MNFTFSQPPGKDKLVKLISTSAMKGEGDDIQDKENQQFNDACHRASLSGVSDDMGRRRYNKKYIIKMAEGVRFELTVELPLQRFSRPSPSTARPPLQQKLIAHSKRQLIAHGIENYGLSAINHLMRAVLL